MPKLHMGASNAGALQPKNGTRDRLQELSESDCKPLTCYFACIMHPDCDFLTSLLGIAIRAE